MRTVTMLCLAACLLMLLSSGCQVATNERSIEQTPEVAITPTKYSQAEFAKSATASPHEKTKIFSFLHWGPSPAKTITAVGPIETSKSGGAKMAGFKNLKDAARGPILLVVIGAIAVLAGAVVFIWVSRPTGLAVAAGGGCLIGAGLLVESYPWVVLAVPILAVGAGVWFFFGTKRGKQLREDYGLTTGALQSTVTGIDVFKESHLDAAKSLTDALKKEQDKVESALVDGMRKKS